MWILGKSETKIINSNQVKSFEITSFDENILWADDVEIGVFITREEAKKELNQIYNALAVGQCSYSIE